MSATALSGILNVELVEDELQQSWMRLDGTSTERMKSSLDVNLSKYSPSSISPQIHELHGNSGKAIAGVVP